MTSKPKSGSPIEGMSNDTWLWLWPITRVNLHLYVVTNYKRYGGTSLIWTVILWGGYLLGWAVGLFNLVKVPDFSILGWQVSLLDVVALGLYFALRFWWKIPGSGKLHNYQVERGEGKVWNVGQMIGWTIFVIAGGFILARIVLLIWSLAMLFIG